MKLGLVQMSVCMDKKASVSKACRLIQEAAENGARVIALPECFNCPYGTQYFQEYSEPVPGPTTKSLSEVAAVCQVYVIGGSIPENNNGDFYNTCTVFSPTGEMIAKYSKMHLFDIDIPEKIKFQESKIFKPGNNFATFDAGDIRIGIAICYDVRFPEIATTYADMGCHLILYPAALNSKTGSDWDIMLRARALDNQLYAAVVSPARYVTPTYCAWGRTTVVDPKGEVLITNEDNETISYVDIALRLGLVQMAVGINKMDNINRACKLIRDAAKKGAKLVALPECFNCPYGTQYFKEYSEPVPGPTTKSLSEVAKECQVYIVGGSIPEDDTGNIYNTCTVFSPTGEMIAKYSKMHLFDIDIPGKITFRESEVLSPGNTFTTFDAGDIRVGLGICYDLRFPDLAHVYADMGCHLLLYPGAFNMTTGPRHWEILQRARALDNQLYVAAISPARDVTATYTAWGYTTAVGPWGDVLATTEHEEDIVYVDIERKVIDEKRRHIPLRSQRRLDLYSRAVPNTTIDPLSKKPADLSGYNIGANSHVD